ASGRTRIGRRLRRMRLPRTCSSGRTSTRTRIGRTRNGGRRSGSGGTIGKRTTNDDEGERQESSGAKAPGDKRPEGPSSTNEVDEMKYLSKARAALSALLAVAVATAA